MWINRYTDRMLARVGLWLTAKLANDENRTQVLATAEILVLNVKLFEPFNHRDAQLIKFTSDYANIMTLTNTLRAASYALTQGIQFDVAMFPPTSRTLSVADFFIDEQRRYIAAGLAVTNFKKEAQAFLKLYFAIEKIDYGIPNYNQRVLSRLLRSTIEAARTLKQFSHEQP